MVFVPFTGIDNHNRCVTFGCGLLAKENIESYKWLLIRFKRAFGRDPKVFVTDQDPAMKQAVEFVYPGSRHRLCMWHIMQKFTAKVFLCFFEVVVFTTKIVYHLISIYVYVLCFVDIVLHRLGQSCVMKPHSEKGSVT